MALLEPNNSTAGFNLAEARALLAVTPAVLRAWLAGLPHAWLVARERPDAWSPFEVLVHLIHGEKTDWMPRVRRILEHGSSLAFDPFDREASFEQAAERPLESLLDEFAALRAQSLADLAALQLTAADLDRKGLHPAFGEVTLRQLLATWTAHDLDHLQQISRTFASRYAEAVGPWRAYLRVVRDSAAPSAAS